MTRLNSTVLRGSEIGIIKPHRKQPSNKVGELANSRNFWRLGKNIALNRESEVYEYPLLQP